MDLRDIEYFAVLAEHGHMGRAAEALGLSQPALSLSLRRLEKSMQTKLVKRTPKGVELTTVGSALLAQVTRLRLARDDVAREVADLSQGRAGHVRIGISPGFGEEVVGPAGSLMLREAPKVTLIVKVLTPAELLPALRNGKLDLAFTNTPATPLEDITHEHLLDDDFVVYASVHHRLAGQKRVTFSDLAQEKWTAHIGSFSWAALQRIFEESNLATPHIALESDSLAVRFHAITSANLLGFTSRHVVKHAAPRFRFAELRVKEFSWVRRLGVIYRKDAYLSPAARRFIEILKATAKEIAKEQS